MQKLVEKPLLNWRFRSVLCGAVKSNFFIFCVGVISVCVGILNLFSSRNEICIFLVFYIEKSTMYNLRNNLRKQKSKLFSQILTQTHQNMHSSLLSCIWLIIGQIKCNHHSVGHMRGRMQNRSACTRTKKLSCMHARAIYSFHLLCSSNIIFHRKINIRKRYKGERSCEVKGEI